jgi:hypothetical protein
MQFTDQNLFAVGVETMRQNLCSVDSVTFPSILVHAQVILCTAGPVYYSCSTYILECTCMHQRR